MPSKARKQKRISKHVLKAKEDQELKANNDAEEPAVVVKKKKKKKHQKDPTEAASYLSSWKYRREGGAWKFNKNTQSWLIRHMYEPGKVQKVTFDVLLDYLDGMPKKDRVIADAEHRALRYKEFEKKTEENPETAACSDIDKEKATEPTIDQDDDEDDETRWKRLSAHEKRKEYKRARKVLEKLQPK